MLLFKKVSTLRNHLESYRAAGRNIGFAPTMGALHEGHLSLIRQARAENDLVVCSIFVNPTQFNDPADLEKYPRTPDKDKAMLEKVGNDVLFMPPAAEIYPPGPATPLAIDFGQLDKVMEGKFRPGHFAGVASVVKRLLDIVEPDRLYMGQKDYQQFAIIQHMIRSLHLPVQLIMCPTVREADGLAMSSRNVRLTPAFRKRAPQIYRTLSTVKQLTGDFPPSVLSSRALNELTTAGLRPEYFEIVDGATLQSLSQWDKTTSAVACTAVWAGEVRLIDNIILK